jgi:hypothetical protein
VTYTTDKTIQELSPAGDVQTLAGSIAYATFRESLYGLPQ